MYCCVECFSEPLIREFIKDHGDLGECDYCDSENVYTAGVDVVGDFVMAGVNRAYEDPQEHVGYDSEEGKYFIPPTDIYEILIYDHEIFSDKPFDQHKLVSALVQDTIMEYVQRDPYGPPPGHSDEEEYWEKFCLNVKKRKRYTAFYTDNNTDETDLSNPTNFMRSIVEDITADYVRPIEKGTKLFRARIEKRGTKFKHKDLTSPPIELSRHNRMSPAGISFFYGSLEEPRTCINEIRPSVGERVVVAEFRVNRKLSVLDLSQDIEKETSIFSKDYSYDHERRNSFLRLFVAEIAKPIRPMDQEIDYVPTQVFTEFVRWWDYRDIYFWDTNTDKAKPDYIDGMVFPSSLRENGKNIVFFKGPEISIKKTKTDTPWLTYRRQQVHQITRVEIVAEPL